MADTQLQTLKRLIENSRVKPDKVSKEWAFHTAWNATLDHVLMLAAKVERGDV